MARVITFSRQFPSYHPKAGKRTLFVEQVLNSLGIDYLSQDYLNMLLRLNDDKVKATKLSFEVIESFWMSLLPTEGVKKTTIRAGHSRTTGMKLLPAIWSGRPYHDPQIIIAPDIEVVKTWDFHIKEYNEGFWIDFGEYNVHPDLQEDLDLLAQNDGLSKQDLLDWFRFPKPFDGQVICWSKDVNY